MRSGMGRALGVLIGALVVCFIGAAGAAQSTSAAGRADGPAGSLEPVTITASGFGQFHGDIRHIPHGNLVPREDKPGPPRKPETPGPGAHQTDAALQTAPATSAPTTGSNFRGLDFASAGDGWPPDPNGDVGPNYYIQAVNTSVGLFDKSSGANVVNISFNDLFPNGSTGTPCDTSNQGDPVALYDPFGDRYIVTDFAWSNFSSGPFYQCFAVSKTNDPTTGGWNFYAWQVETGSSLPDYPKLGVWPDGIYMSANVFATTGSQQYQHAQVWVFNRQQMEAGNPSPQGVTFNLPASVGGLTVFSLLPSNARSVTGAPPAGSPNYFASIWGSYAIRVWKFHVDWTTPANSTFTGPTNVGVSVFNVGPGDADEKDGNTLDTLSYRLMMQNQYTNIGGRESLWLTHTVGSGGLPNLAQIRWYELPVTGGTISGVRQQSTWAPSATFRFMPSLAVDKNGDMAVGYSVSDASMYPALRVAGRLAGDPLNQLTQGETTLVQGLGFQCCTFSDGSTNNRWGDYSAMSIDPDGCTFWYTGEYYDAHPTTLLQDNWLTRIASFQLPGCSGAVPSAPTVTSFNPTSGPVGSSVTITGTNFTGASSVTFSGTGAVFSVNSDTQITATVPSGATSGPIAVTTPGGTGTSASSFTVTSATPAPSISGFSPTSGPVGTSVTINGTAFTGATSVRFNGTTASFTVVSDTQLTSTVPSGATSGPISVTTPGGTGTSASSFTVTVAAPAPTITSFTPTSGPPTSTVTITGTNFTGATSVAFSGRAASFAVISPTQITATVPRGAKTGPISVTTSGGTATSSNSFTVTKR